jgi:hypothetical protein
MKKLVLAALLATFALAQPPQIKSISAFLQPIRRLNPWMPITRSSV